MLDCDPRNASVGYWPIVLKKSAMVCASGKYASEIEIFTFGRGFRTRISRSSVQKRHFHQSMIRPFGQTDFFNRIGRSLPVMATKQAGQIRCNWWSERMQMTGQVECKRVVKWSAISHRSIWNRIWLDVDEWPIAVSR